MPADTADKRASAIHIGLPWRTTFPAPDVAAEDAADRRHLLGYYRGASVSAVLTGTAIGGITEQHLVDGGRTIVITLTGDSWIPA